MRYVVPELAAGIAAGSRASIARAITLVESAHPDHRALAHDLIAALEPPGDPTVRVGISGVPGAGKSTFIDALGTRLIERGHRVAVLAVDPSSSRSGGSILGDRTRMAALAASDGAFIRPSPSGRHLGGVARATRESMLVLESAGFDVVLIETVGVGQSEIAVADMVDTFLLLALSRTGDQLQGIKRGILERADVIAVNKADGPHAHEARLSARELAGAMRLMFSDPEARRPPVLTCSAHTGDGLDDVWDAVMEHRDFLRESGSLRSRRALQQREWMWTMVDTELATTIRQLPAVDDLRRDLQGRVEDGTLSAVDAADQLLDAFAVHFAQTRRDASAATATSTPAGGRTP
ncbi:MAG: methylmalonyl Co-A mutase-associated GTPase MeaB [Thermoleophilia bacterium]|nr:methylmalonyl Co-A mutase-associated GTPase MeaB [Thermoleophilia bacterium]